jgi:4-phospho-D-threonate 3-dehydrogenase / 4-phospho-D-erythronate 3-dehydrogenase
MPSPYTMKPTIAVTMGDPAGIGPEVVVRALALRSLHRFCHLVVFGDPRVLARAVSLTQVSLRMEDFKTLPPPSRSPHPVLRVLDCTKVDMSALRPGIPTPDTGRAAYDSIHAAARLALRGAVSGITTAPISKKALSVAGYAYPGHTEMLAELSRADEVGMLLVAPSSKSHQGKHAPEVRILLVTTHLPLQAVSKALTVEKVTSAIRLAHQAAWRLWGMDRPKVAVSAMNPHAGEDGLFGPEEETIILPAIRKAREQGLDSDGPFPADTLIVNAARGRYDFVIAMYHDQAMIPIKLLSFGRAVNITVGLPFIRTSVDHGTAYDIAWKGRAHAGSLVAAIRLATRLIRRSHPGSRSRAS